MPFQDNNELLDKARNWSKKELPFVLYCYPDESLLRGIFQEDNLLRTLDDHNAPGFVFVPFTTNKKKILITGRYSETLFTSHQIAENENPIAPSAQGKAEYIRCISRALNEIAQGHLKKVIVSRSIDTQTRKEPEKIMTALMAHYPRAFRYWWFHPKVGTWMGATPERLLHYKDNTLTTASLAGTLPVKKDSSPNWSPKEVEEQQLVTDYIMDQLKSKVEDLKNTRAKNKRAGKLWHLHSTITAKLASFDSLPKVIDSLHPTPAVCGLPATKAMDFIAQNEEYDREYYSGYLGTLNMDAPQGANLFVNLRCLKYTKGAVRLFVGAGITQDSDPDSEWEETQHKSKTILSVL